MNSPIWLTSLQQRWHQIVGPLSSRDLWATLWGALGQALLLFSYFLIRPIREVHGTRIGAEGLNLLFFLTFLTLLVVTPLWGMLVRVCSKRSLPIALMTLIAGSLVVFAQWLRTDAPPRWVSMSFFVWVSVFNYMMVSLYWSVMVDSFSPAVSRRTFGVIAAGGSAGAMLGPLAASLLASRLSASATLLVSAGLFLCVPLFLLAISRRPTEDQPEIKPPPENDSIISGLVETVSHRYLMAIAGYMLLGSLLGSLLYVHQSGSIQAAIPNEDDRRSFFATTDLAANFLTLVLELLVAAPLLSWGGLRWPLLLLPLLGLAAAPLLTVWPSALAVAALLVVRRATEYGLAKPGRELLFTVVNQSQKYKAKNFIDSVVARGGDSIGSSVSRLVAAQHWPPVVALWIGTPIALIFGGLGVWLAREQQRRAQASTESTNKPTSHG